MSSLSKISFGVALLCLILAAIYILRPPGETQIQQKESAVIVPKAWMDSGKLPGITWTDDIHPIFVRNKCGDCHTRGQEDSVEGLTEFALGMIDPDDAFNPFYSYHELVYREGKPYKITGETLRDGQCCWPKGFPADQQRRIWLGHPERSALLRKLERNYYDWNKPPRFLGEGLRLQWGLPMPLWQEKNDHSKNDAPAVPDDHHGGQQGTHEESVYSISLPGRMAFRASLWFGMEHDKLMALPPRIPAQDIVMLRYWIANTIHLQNGESGINVRVVNQENLAVAGEEIIMVGNYKPPDQQEIKESFTMKTDEAGQASLSFKAASVVSKLWYVGLNGDNIKDFEKIAIDQGIIKKITIKL